LIEKTRAWRRCADRLHWEFVLSRADLWSNSNQKIFRLRRK